MLHNSRIYIIISMLIELVTSLLAFYILYGENAMNTDSIAILVAVLGLIGTIAGGIIVAVVEIVKSKKQSGEIREDIGDVKADTADMKPRTGNIERNTEKIRDEVVEKLVPNIQTISSMASKVERIHSEVEYKKRIKSELSTVVQTKDYFVEGIENLYEKNGQLESENKELHYQLNQAQEQNQFLTDRISELEEENRELSKQLDDQTREHRQENQAPMLF